MAVFLVALLAAAPARTDGPVDDDPLPIRRVALRPDQLAAELERAERGVLLQMPRARFEDMVRQAAATSRAARSTPRLAATHYRATFTGDALVGSAEWRVTCTGPTPALFSAEPLQLAVRAARWADGTAALLTDLDPRPQAHGVELWVDRPGERALALEWSARGVPEPGGVRFDLRVPACAIATFDLVVPAGYEPFCAREGGLLTGPTLTDESDLRAWRLVFGGTSQIDLLFRPPPGAGSAPLVLVRQQNMQDVGPGQTTCEFALDLDVRHAGVRELRLECDPALRPTDIAVRNVGRWEVKPAETPGAPGRVAVEFREQFQGGTLTFRGVAPTPADRAWVSPWVRVVDAAPRGEQLTVRVHPDLAYRDFRAGSFRLVNSGLAADHAAMWTLQGGSVRAAPNRPAARFGLRGPEYVVRQRQWWHVEPDRETLTTESAFDVSRGPVFQIPWQLPAGWDIDRVEAAPADALGGWAMVPPTTAAGRPTLAVEFQRPLGPGSTTRLHVVLARRGPRARTLAVPDFRPPAARGRTGTLAVRVAGQFQPSWGGAADRTPATLPAEVAALAPWSPDPANSVFALRTAASAGQLTLQPWPTRLQARVSTVVTVAGRLIRVAYKLRLEPLAGGTDVVLVHTTPSEGLPSDWRVANGSNLVRSTQRIDAMAPAAAIGGAAESLWPALAALSAACPNGTLWAITMARPVTEPVELEAGLDLELPPARDASAIAAWFGGLAAHDSLGILLPWASARASGTWPTAIPLVTVPAAAGAEHEVSIDLSAAGGVEARHGGMREVAAADVSVWRRRYVYGPDPARLWLTSAARDSVEGGTVSGALLHTDTTDPDRLLHTLRVRLRDWPTAYASFGLPSAATVREVRVNGSAAPVRPSAESEPWLKLAAPLVRGESENEVTVVFATPHPRWWVGTRYTPPEVQLPAAAAVRHSWTFPPDITPLDATGRQLPFPDTDDGLRNRASRGPATWEPTLQSIGVPVMRRRDVTMIGLSATAAVMVCCALAAFRSSGHGRFVPVFILATTGLLAVWLPAPLRPAAWWPFVAVAAWAVALVVLPLARWDRPEPGSQGMERSAVRRGAVTAGVAAVVWLVAEGRAAAPGPATVFLVPDAAGSLDAGTALVPPALADQLQDLARRGAAAPDGARIAAARYDGEVTGRTARFRAILQVHSFADGPATVTLPLTGVQIRDAVLNGRPAYPKAAGDRYTVSLTGRGAHTLELTFHVPVTSSGEDREVRFGVPDVAQSHLTLSAPPAARLLQAVSRRGAQTERVTSDGARLDADLGRVGAVHVRWRSAADAEAEPATVRVREAYLWDLTDAGATLHGALQYAVTGGSVLTLAADLPRDLLVAAVSARPLDTTVPGAAAGWLRQWRVVPHDRGARLVLDFGTPVTGNWQVTVALVPRAPWPARPTLAFPTAVGVNAAHAAVAYRTAGVTAALEQVRSLAPLAEETFLRDHWLPAQIEANPRSPTRAFQRTAGGGAPALRLAVAPTAADIQTVEEWAWTVGPRRADVNAESTVSVRGGTVTLLEWDVPSAVRVTDVTGPEVLTWSRSGGRLQVWLERPVATTAVKWTGAVTRPADAAARFDVPAVRPTGVPFRGTLRVAARDGWALSPVQTPQLRPAAGAGAGDRAWTYQTESPAYKASFLVQSAAELGEYRLSTVVSLRDGRVRAEATVECRARGDRMPGLRMVVRNAAAFDVRVDAPAAASVRELASAADRRTWVVDLPPSSPGVYRLTVSAVARSGASTECVVPHVDLDFVGQRPARLDREVTLDENLAPIEASGLRPAASPRTWQVVADGWLLRVRPAPSPRPPEVVLTEAEAFRGGDGRWVRRATYWLVSSGIADLSWQWPTPVRILRVAMNDGRLVPPPAVATSYRIPLAGAGGDHKVVLEWEPDHADLLPTAPSLPLLRADDFPVAVSSVLWTITAPQHNVPLAPPPISPTEVALHRAHAQLRLAERLLSLSGSPAGRDLSRQRRAAQERGDRALRLAEAKLAGGATPDADAEPLVRWLRQLRDRIPQVTNVALDSDDAEAVDPLAWPGTAHTWYADARQSLPVVTWARPRAWWAEPLWRTAVLAALLPAALWWRRRLGDDAWPELLAVIGGGLWLASGGEWLWLVPAAAGLIARATILVQSVMQRWRPAEPSPPAALV